MRQAETVLAAHFSPHTKKSRYIPAIQIEFIRHPKLRHHLRRRARAGLCDPPEYGKFSIAWEKAAAWKERSVIKAVAVYVAAAFFEIAGHFSFSLWLREGESAWWDRAGTASLLLLLRY